MCFREPRIPTLSEWRKKNTCLYLRCLSGALERNMKVPVIQEDGTQAMRTLTPAIPMTKMSSLRPFMFPPEFTDKAAARKSFKKSGHWRKIDFEWVPIEKIKTPRGYEQTDECDEACRFWKKFLEHDIPIPAIRVYSDDDLTLISDGVQRVNALKEAGYKYVLVYFRYETNTDPPP